MNVFSIFKLIHLRSKQEKRFNFENNDIFNSLFPFQWKYFTNRNFEIDLNKKIRIDLGIQGEVFLFGSARMALYFFLIHLNVKNKPYVAVQSFTCGVVVNAIIRAGYIPLYLDIDENTLGTSFDDFKKLNQKYKNQIAAIIVQHSFGLPADIDDFVKLSKEENIYVIEDCATTLGSYLDQKLCGNFGDASIWSFDSTKPLSIGNGGMLTVKNKKISKNISINFQNLPYQSDKEFMFFAFNYLAIQIANSIIFNPYFRTYFIEINRLLVSKIFSFKGYHQDWDYLSKMPRNYNYPSRLHKGFIFSLFKSVGPFKKIQDRNKNLMKIIKNNKNIHKSFKNEKSRLIVPFRIFFNKEMKIIENLVNQEKAWYKSPLQGIQIGKENKDLRYKNGQNPLTEKINNETNSIPIHAKLIFILKNFI